MRLRPRFSVRWLMVGVAVVGLIAAMGVWMTTHLGTRYASGFSESGFTRLLPGMTPAQVEQFVGTPLERVPWPTQGDVENWVYSESPIGGDYEMRWVIFENKVVKEIVKHHWEE